MSRAPSEATQIRTLRRQLRDATGEVSSLRLQVRVAQGQATKAQQETADWKRRFDALLKVMPEKDTPNPYDASIDRKGDSHG